MYLAIATDGCNRRCRRQWCKCTPKSFDLLKIWAKSLKIWQKWRPMSFYLENGFFWRSGTAVFMRKYSHKKWPNNFSGKFRKFGQKSFATPQICLLLHLWLQSHRPQKLEVKIIVSLVSVHCKAYGFGLLLYG